MLSFNFARRVSDSLIYRTSLLRQILRSSHLKRNTIVTVFGSCRQDSLSKHFTVTRIRDYLTYPHYAKEVIQAIDFCKSGGGVDLRVFRNSLLNLRMLKPKQLKIDFESTDIFVVEIASLLQYTKGHNFFHHVAVDLVEGIEISKQTFESLREDIIEIIEKLSPKPVVFSTHYSTRKSGGRVQLMDFIIKTCRELRVPCINPSEMNEVWESSLLHVNEPIINHLTPLWHEIMADRYREVISLNLTEAPIPVLVQKYKPGIVVRDYHGLGDFIFGSLRVHQEALSRGKLPLIDISEHPISKFMHTNHSQINSGITPVLLECDSHLFQSSKVVFTHLRPLQKPSAANIDFVLRNSFRPLPNFAEEIEEQKESLGILENPYFAIHLRLGDQFMASPNSKTEMLTKHSITKIINFIRTYSARQKTVVSTDSIHLTEELRSVGIPILTGEVAHLGKNNQKDSAIKDSLIHFMILKDSKRIIQVSNYGWGSGFSKTASILGQMEILELPMHELLKS